ncbi:MAG TPA: helix-hairpin-helix domain-containing protein [Polyangiaceae bacterium]|nr:helix-hairpin-helix domain-containing protein [Polyangiaceae bacterium]
MAWVEERAPVQTDAQLDLHGGGRWPAPAQAQPIVAHSLILRGLAVVAGVLTLAGVGAAASLAHLPSAETALRGELGLQAINSVWLAPSPAPEMKPEPQAQQSAPATPEQPESGEESEARPRHDEQRPPGLTSDGKVILNAADASELTRLPGVGEKRAEAIVRLRERLGRFKRMHDLLRVRGIGPRALRKIKLHAVLDAPKPDAGS